eukprot:scaffold215672_cov23-Tisochrysis_lutea.AAC.3
MHLCALLPLHACSYLSSHEDPKTVDGFASRPKISNSRSLRGGEEVIGGRKLRKQVEGMHLNAQSRRGLSGLRTGVEIC